MEFLYPTYLWGFLLVLIPVLIHLFQLRRYRLVYFSSLKFLKQLNIEQKRRSRIRDLLLLLVRILLISALVLAFSHPYFPGKKEFQQSGQTVGIYIDNSLSMENEAEGKTLFDHAKRTAIERIKALPPDTRYYILHNDDFFSSRLPLEQKDIISSIELLRLSSRSSDLGSAIERFNRIISLNNDRASAFLVFSDFQESFIIQGTMPDSLDFPVRIITAPGSSANNIFVDSCWFESPVHNIENRQFLHARIHNFSDQDLNRFPVHLLIRDSLVAQETVTAGPYSSSDISFSFSIESGGWQEGKIEIRDYPVSFDNDFYFTYFISDKIPVLQIFSGTPNVNLQALFGSDDYFSYSEADAASIPFQDLGSFRLILLNSPDMISSHTEALLKDYLQKGGNLIITPPEKGNPDNINSFLRELDLSYFGSLLSRQSEARIPENMKEFYRQVSLNPDKQVEWPVFLKYYSIENRRNLNDVLLTNETGNPLLTRSPYGNGFVSISAAPFAEDFTNFQVHPLFIPFLYLLANTGLDDQRLYYRIGTLDPVSLDIGNIPSRGSARVSEKNDGGYDAIPNQTWDQQSGRLMLYLGDYPGKSGILEVKRSEGMEALIAMNYSAGESLVQNLSATELNKLKSDYGWEYISIDQGSGGQDKSSIMNPKGKSMSLVSFLLLLALLFLLFESIIHRMKA